METNTQAFDRQLPTDEERDGFRIDDCRRVHGRLKSLAHQRAALDANEARDLVEAEELEIWSAFGYTTMLAYLEGELGYGPHTASERLQLRVARALVGLPLTAKKLEAGALHHSAVRELTRVATDETEQAWLDAIASVNLRQVERLVAGHVLGDLPDDNPDPDLELRNVTIELSPATYALYRQVRRHLDTLTGERLSEDAAMEMMCRAALATPGGGEPGATAQVSLTVCKRCARATQDGAGIEADVDIATLARMLCDAEILGDADAGAPPRVTATVTPRARRHVLARDHHRCAVPGCRNARFVQIHHVEFR